MKNQNNNPIHAFQHKRQFKDKHFRSQLKTIFQYLQVRIATSSMISAMGIPQRNVCRYKRDLERIGRLLEVEKSLCKHTGNKAWCLSTNPDNISFDNQLNSFK